MLCALDHKYECGGCIQTQVGGSSRQYEEEMKNPIGDERWSFER